MSFQVHFIVVNFKDFRIIQISSIFSAFQTIASHSKVGGDSGIQGGDGEGDFATIPPHFHQSTSKEANPNQTGHPLYKTRSKKRIGEVTAAVEELKELDKATRHHKNVDEECETFGK